MTLPALEKWYKFFKKKNFQDVFFLVHPQIYWKGYIFPKLLPASELIFEDMEMRPAFIILTFRSHSGDVGFIHAEQVY